MGPYFIRKYAVGSGADVYVPITKRAVVDYAVGADWTPAAGDVKISIDGGAAANIATLPTAIAMGNTAYWKFVFSNAELTGKQMFVTVADSATKAVEDQAFGIATCGHASAMYIRDFTVSDWSAIGSEADGVETGVTVKQALRAIAAAEAGEASGLDTGSVVLKAIGNSGTTRVSGTGSTPGNRTSITLNL